MQSLDGIVASALRGAEKGTSSSCPQAPQRTRAKPRGRRRRLLGAPRPSGPPTSGVSSAGPPPQTPPSQRRAAALGFHTFRGARAPEATTLREHALEASRTHGLPCRAVTPRHPTAARPQGEGPSPPMLLSRLEKSPSSDHRLTPALCAAPTSMAADFDPFSRCWRCLDLAPLIPPLRPRWCCRAATTGALPAVSFGPPAV